MANTVNITFANSSDNSTCTATDATTYSSPTRGTCGVFIKVYKTDFEGSKSEQTITLDSSDPDSTSTATFDLDVDGWYQVYYVAPPDYSAGTTYAIYAAVFDSATNLVYRSKSGSNVGNSILNTTYWEPILDPVLLAENKDTATESANTDTLIIDKVFAVNTLEIRDRYALDVATTLCGDCDLSSQVNMYELFDIMVTGMEAAETYNEFAQGERIARRAEALSVDC